ncbi:MAG: DUF1440 domain-containing protein, partial [Chloroflexi bacterium]|nr:DUF1440 domain-containing protein [Chloroflexota bacterium]
TVTMALLFRRLPARQRYPLPPARITAEMADRAELEEHVDEPPEHLAATGVGHFGYGALGGTVYRLALEPVALPPLVKGVVFGSVVWALSYLGWLPAFEILPPATRQPTERTLLMIAAHWVYGAGLGLAADALTGEE